MNILLTSVGRRPYLVQWFKDALEENDLYGKVIAADVDSTSPARAFSDRFVKAPRVDAPAYKDWLKQLLVAEDIKLAISVNDFELSEWSRLPSEPEWKPLIRLSKKMQTYAEDKYLMHSLLQEHSILTPSTWLGNEKVTLREGSDLSFVTKGRFGSASRGLNFIDWEGIEAAVQAATYEVTDRQGISALEQSNLVPEELVIIQEKIEGTEFGIDIVSDFSGDFAAVLARKKLSMRSGETDRAITVDPHLFEPLARKLAIAVPHPGSMDVDVIVDKNGQIYVIDINPRFGGGYPFSHAAGARVPTAYVAWAAAQPISSKWFAYQPEIIGSKYIDISRVN